MESSTHKNGLSYCFLNLSVPCRIPNTTPTHGNLYQRAQQTPDVTLQNG